MKRKNKRILAALLTIAAIGTGIATYFESQLWFGVCFGVIAVLTIIAIIDAIIDGDEFWFNYGYFGGVLCVMAFLTGAIPGVPEILTNSLMVGAGFMIPSCSGYILRKLGS